MTKLFLTSLTTLAFAASTATAFAQDPQHDIDAKTEMTKSKTSETSESDEMEAVETLEKPSDMTDDWADETADAKDEPVVIMEETAKDALPETDMASCPEGTKLMADGSCHVTEDWMPED